MEETGILKMGTAAVAERYHRGTNQSGMRDYNERLTLSLVRRHGSLSKTEIARLTRLSAQTVSVIMRELEDEGLLLRNEPIRGKIGQPSIPMSLNPEGAFFLGLKIGRRSAELVLIDFLGAVRAMLQLSYRYPTPRETVEFVSDGIKRIRAGLTPAQDERIAGLGIAMPFELWNWADEAGAPREVMEHWRNRDIRADIQAQVSFPVYLQNDATSACGAELVFGSGGTPRDFIYFYIGAFAGGGIVLNGGLYGGPTGNAGALGSMPVPGPGGAPRQLIDIASIAMLEKALNAKGRRCLATVDLAAGLGRPRRGARPMDRLGRQWPGLRHRRGIVGDRLPGGGGRRLDAGLRARPPRRGDRRSAAEDRRRGPDGAAGARRHGRHPCASAWRREPAAFGPLPGRGDRRRLGLMG